MRISDWSSDVCSSDLCGLLHRIGDCDHARCSAVDRDEDRGRAVAAQRIGLVLQTRNVCALLRQESGITERSEEHTSELQSLMRISYAVFCLKKKKHNIHTHKNHQITIHHSYSNNH